MFQYSERHFAFLLFTLQAAGNEKPVITSDLPEPDGTLDDFIDPAVLEKSVWHCRTVLHRAYSIDQAHSQNADQRGYFAEDISTCFDQLTGLIMPHLATIKRLVSWHGLKPIVYAVFCSDEELPDFEAPEITFHHQDSIRLTEAFPGLDAIQFMVRKPRKHPAIWHPFTQHGMYQKIVEIDRAEGAYLFTKDGDRIIDAISSWWVTTHGHCHPQIVEAVQKQAGKLDQIIFSGFTHDPAERLAEKLIGFFSDTDLVHTLSYAFFSDSGSTAVEVALKMAIGYWAQKGKPRRKVLALEGGYHGDTFGAMSAGARSVFNRLYEPYLFEVEYLPFPSPGKEDETFAALKKTLQESGGDIAAFIFEPLVQGAAGMRFYSPKVLQKIINSCESHQILTIADEVMTGFGRTGTRYACEQAGFIPDLLCLSKGLTGGYLPMGATLAKEHIYKAFFHKDRARMFFHSTSFTGNPLACAAAEAALDIWVAEKTEKKIKTIEKSYKKAAAHFNKREDVENVRSLGSIFALDIVEAVPGYLSEIQPFLYQTMLSRNVLLRPLGNTVYILPPYCVTAEDLDTIYECIDFALDRLRDERQKQVA